MLLAISVVVLHVCAAPAMAVQAMVAPKPANTPAVSATESADDGLYVRLVTIEVDVADVSAWEAAVREIAGAARAAGENFDAGWLLYREGSARYRAVFHSGGLCDLQTHRSFAEAFVGTPAAPMFHAAVDALLATRFTVVEDLVHQREPGWSTGRAMNPRIHLGGRLTKYWVRPGAGAAFDAAMRERARLLREAKYPYPVEGFAWKVGSPGMNYACVFPDSWDAFHGINEVRTVMRRHELEARYDSVMTQIGQAVLRTESIDLDLDPDLSY